MAKGIIRQASKDDPIYNGRVVVSSKTNPKKSEQSSEATPNTEIDVVEEDDGHQCHYGKE